MLERYCRPSQTLTCTWMHGGLRLVGTCWGSFLRLLFLELSRSIPIGDWCGSCRLHAICEKVFDQMDQISIQVTEHAVNGNVAFNSWKVNVTYKKKLETIEGTKKGLVKATVDYDDASIVFETVPVLGSLLKWLRKRLP